MNTYKIINIFKGLPFWLKPGCDNFGKTAIKLDNGSRIISSATTNTASIGFTIHCVLLDEFAHIPENIVNNFWRSVFPTHNNVKAPCRSRKSGVLYGAVFTDFTIAVCVPESRAFELQKCKKNVDFQRF